MVRIVPINITKFHHSGLIKTGTYYAVNHESDARSNEKTASNSYAMLVERKENREKTTKGCTLKETTEMVDQTGAFLQIRKRGEKKKENKQTTRICAESNNEMN